MTAHIIYCLVAIPTIARIYKEAKAGDEFAIVPLAIWTFGLAMNLTAMLFRMGVFHV